MASLLKFEKVSMTKEYIQNKRNAEEMETKHFSIYL